MTLKKKNSAYPSSWKRIIGQVVAGAGRPWKSDTMQVPKRIFAEIQIILDSG